MLYSYTVLTLPLQTWQGFFVSDCTALELMQDVKWDNCKPPYASPIYMHT